MGWFVLGCRVLPEPVGGDEGLEVLLPGEGAGWKRYATSSPRCASSSAVPASTRPGTPVRSTGWCGTRWPTTTSARSTVACRTLPDVEGAVKSVLDAVAGFGPLQQYFDAPDIEEIWINEPSKVFVARGGLAELTTTILSADEVRDLVERMLKTSGRRVDLSSRSSTPMLPDGSRLHVVIPDITRAHWHVNIRKLLKSITNHQDPVGDSSVCCRSSRLLRGSLRRPVDQGESLNSTFRRRLSLAWRTLLALAGFALAAIVTGNQLGVFTLMTATQRWGCAVALAGVTFVDNVRAARMRHTAPRKLEARSRVQKVFVALLVQLAREKSVAIEHLGASVFVPRRVFYREGWRIRYAKVLVRILRFRLDDHPQPSNVRWTKGKGAVGECWKKGRVIHRDWRRTRTRFGRETLTEAQFADVPDHAKDNFRFEEFRSIADKYSEVLAVPVLSDHGATVGSVNRRS